MTLDTFSDFVCVIVHGWGYIFVSMYVFVQNVRTILDVNLCDRRWQFFGFPNVAHHFHKYCVCVCVSPMESEHAMWYAKKRRQMKKILYEYMQS